jgi:hypothetical protein
MKNILTKYRDILFLNTNNGHLLKPSFSLLYLLISVFVLLGGGIQIFFAVNLHNANKIVVATSTEYKNISKDFNYVKEQYELTVDKYNYINSALQNAHRKYQEYKNEVDYYERLNFYYYGYILEQREANYQASKWYKVIREKDKALINTQSELNTLTPKYERLLAAFLSIEQKQNEAIANYKKIAPMGAYHLNESTRSGIIALIIICFVSFVLGIFLFLLWLKRIEYVNQTSIEADGFVIQPIAHFIQTLGVSMGIFVSIYGFFNSLVAIIFKVNFGSFFLQSFFVNNHPVESDGFNTIFSSLITPIIYGAAIFVIFIVISKSIKSIYVIPNNTRK